ncbi:MAG: PQQ-binding-like beta-propeller repeat protein [Chloroflexota bacterium]
MKRNKQDRADRFSRDIDNILHETGISDDEGTSAEYEELLSLARNLATTDYSQRSRIRHSLRRRLLNRVGPASMTIAEIAGPGQAIKQLFRRNPDRIIERRQRSLSPVLTAVALALIVAVGLLLSPYGLETRQQMTAFVGRLLVFDRPISVITVPFRSELTETWQFRGESGISSPPFIASGQLYAGSNEGYLYQLNLETGEPAWQFQTESRIEASPIVFENSVYASDTQGTLYAVERQTGQELWRFNTGSPSTIAPTGTTQFVYFGNEAGVVYALDRETGTIAWQVQLDGGISADPLVVDNTLYIGSKDWHLYALDPQTGDERWRFKTGDWVAFTPLVVDDVLYFGTNDRTFYAVETDTGQARWRIDVGAGVTSVAAASTTEGLIYFGSFGYLYAVDGQTGEERWRFQTGNPIFSDPVVTQGLIYFGSSEGNLHVLDAATGEEKGRFVAGSQIQTSPVVVERVEPTSEIVNQYIYFTDGKGDLYSVQHTPVFTGSAETIFDDTATGFQFIPKGWYKTTDEVGIRFRGRIIDGSDQPINGVVIQLDNGLTQILAAPSGSNAQQPQTEAGTWEIVIPEDQEDVAWWWLTVVQTNCSPIDADSDADCEIETRLSESIKVEVVAGDVINADWVCTRDCSVSQ